MTSLLWRFTSTSTPPSATIPLTDLSWLGDLPPGVAYAALATIVVVTLLWHFGGPLRERLRPKPAEQAKPEAQQQPSSAALPAAVDRASEANERFINHLLRQIAEDAHERDETVSRLIRERDSALQRVQELQAENMRLQQMLWRSP